MTDNVKFLVAEINRTLKKDYNLITFDALSVEMLLQVFVDLLQSVGASGKVKKRVICKLIKKKKHITHPQYTVKDADPADTNRHILEILKKIQYRPSSSGTINTDNHDPAAFRRNLLQGDRKTIYPIFQFIFENTERIRNLTYLAQ